MIIEKDIAQIREIASRKFEENLAFRLFLKGCDDEEVDAVVQRLYREITPEIDCLSCANCCKQVLPVLSQKDIKRLAGGLKIPVDAFKKRYLINRSPDGAVTFNKKPCPLLEGHACSQYLFRPRDCRSYPHLQKKDFSFRLINVIENISVCPIVFNVFEALKKEFEKYF